MCGAISFSRFCGPIHPKIKKFILWDWHQKREFEEIVGEKEKEKGLFGSIKEKKEVVFKFSFFSLTQIVR